MRSELAHSMELAHSIRSGYVRVPAILTSLVIGGALLAQGGQVPLPGDARAGHFDRLKSLVEQERWVEAEALSDELIRRGPATATVQYLAGVIRWQREDKIGAIQAFRSAERQGLDTPYLHMALGLAYYDVNQFVLFRAQMERVIQLDSAAYQAHFYIGRYFESVKNDFPEAARHFGAAIERNRGHVESLYFLGYCQEVLQHTDEALSSYREAIRKMEESGKRTSLPYQGLVRILTDTDPDEALSWARNAVELEPEDAENHYLLAQVYRRLGDDGRAIEHLAEVVRLDPDYDSAHLWLFRLYKKRGRAESATKHLELFKRLRAVYGDQ